MLNGALLAIEEVNVSAAFPFVLNCVVADPGGLNARYANVAKSMLTEGGLRHVIGCYTSSSRKEVQPYFEKYDGLLWYPSHYEGFESCEIRSTPEPVPTSTSFRLPISCSSTTERLPIS